jgi:L-2-hydroxyglutarate oxidase LhgO
VDELDVAVIGAGVVGLAVARALALRGREVVVLEAEPAIGTHTSSRNSEVIHAGIYYPTGSLKARLCVAGKHALYAYCADHDVPHRRIGKVIVAGTDAERPILDRYRAQASANGVDDLVPLSRAEVRALEPDVECVAGMLSPSTGIVDSHVFMRALQTDLEGAGGRVLLATPVVGGGARAGGVMIEVGGREPFAVLCRSVINSAGLFAQDVARRLDGLAAEAIPPQHFAKAHYFTLAGRSPFRRLVYPLPVPGGLGIHVTLDMGGQARFGPDVEWVDGVDYTFDETRAPAFYAAIRSYFPALADGALNPGYTGVRPKLAPAGAAAKDFMIQGPAEHGVPGLVNLYGIESPGLTAALAIGGEVAALLGS